MTSLAHITHVVFDLDGLLLNTEDIYTQVFDEMTMRYAHTHFTPEAKRLVQGRCLTEGEELIRKIFGVRESVHELDRAAHDLLDALLPNSDLTPGTERLVKHLYTHNIPMGIATGSDPQGWGVKTAKNREFFGKYFHHVVMSGDPEVKNGKPAPDVFLACANRFTEKPKSMKNVLVFDDAFLGIKGALAADMPCVWIPSVPGLDTTTLSATVVLKSLEEFKPELFDLPPFDDDLEQQGKAKENKRTFGELPPNLVTRN